MVEREGGEEGERMKECMVDLVPHNIELYTQGVYCRGMVVHSVYKDNTKLAKNKRNMQNK